MRSPQLYDDEHFSLDSKLEKFKVGIEVWSSFCIFSVLGNFQQSCWCEEEFCFKIGFPIATNCHKEVTALETSDRCLKKYCRQNNFNKTDGG